VKKTVLLVEDSESLRTIFTEFIEFDGIYTVHPCQDAFEALTWLANNPRPDFVLTDLNLPGGGESVAIAVHKVGIPVAIFSVSPEKARDAILKYNVNIPILSKSIDGYAILKVIDSLTSSLKQPA
jgi:CheY-like chemotaxis protein